MLMVVGFLIIGGVCRADVQAGRTGLTVRIYNTAGLSADELRLVIRGATVPFDSAGITITWTDCSSGTGSGTSVDDCRRPVGPTELVVRIVPHLASDQAPTASRRRTSGYVAMGYSLVNVPTPSFASVNVAVVKAVADEAGADVRVVLGRAVAHELGHLLLNTNGHGDQGLMRARWSRQELSRDESRDWRFSDREVAAMRVAIERRARQADGVTLLAARSAAGCSGVAENSSSISCQRAY
jgi:hypothetical protein